jgi:PAS domain-containing protein
MTAPDLFDTGFILATSVCASVATAFVVLALAPRLRADPSFSPDDVLGEPRRFVFSDGYLLEHSGGAGFLIPTPIDHLTAWDSLEEALSDVMDGVADAFAALITEGRAFRLSGLMGKDRITVSGVRDGDITRITVAAAGKEQDSVRIDQATLDGLTRDMGSLRAAAETTPALSWCIDSSGQIIWANAAYRTHLAAIRGPDAASVWPIGRLFPDETTRTIGTLRRKIAAGPGKPDTWFELTIAEVANGERYVHAMPMDKVVRAEDNLRNFIQTLTKTFAHLPIGLAIFDKDRHLAMFNPALIDLTYLDGAWLSQRPTLASFFDQLRERQRLPEPKDYKSWRDSLTALERTEGTGTYEETWSLPSGQTYRVTGRPHPDGAVALLIEDISAEISVTRRFRADLEVFQSVFDSSDEAVVVFTAAGQLTLSNTRYAEIWGVDPRFSLTEISAAASIRHWQDLAEPSPAWGDLRSYIGQMDDRAEWFEDIVLRDGRSLQLRVSPVAGGMTLVGFAEKAPVPVVLPEPAGTAQLAG